MDNTKVLTKRMAISKANAQMVAVVSGAVFITIFCLVAAHTVWSQNTFQAKVTTAKEQAHKQLLANLSAYNQLANSYEKFVSRPTNVIGGSSNGNTNNQGNNAKIILDALPSTYDFPALTSSLAKILTNNNLDVTSISGTDNQLSEESNTFSPNPQPVSMPFTFTISNASYGGITQLITELQQSIRPIQIDTIQLSGDASDMTITVAAHTYFQPGKSVSITKELIK